MFKIGDEVTFGADEEGYPLWDMDWRRDADWHHDAVGRVIEADDRGYLLRLDTSEGPDEWHCLQHAPGDADEHWFRPAGRSALAAREPVWTEIVNVRRRSDLPDPVRERMIDAGERGVRRTLRHWPANKRLIHEETRIPGDLEDRVEVRWFWEDAP